MHIYNSIHCVLFVSRGKKKPTSAEGEIDIFLTSDQLDISLFISSFEKSCTLYHILFYFLRANGNTKLHLL